MRVVVNAVPARGTSLGVVTENLLRGWIGLGLEDELHLVVRSGVELEVPDGVRVHPVDGSRLRAMDIGVPALCRRLRADALLGVTPATTMAPLPCPRTVIALDIRHELRPQQFSLRRRLLRRISYGIGYRQADAIVCISQRTHDDLVAAHPFLRSRRVTVAPLGADHVLTWPPRRPGPEYALAFGQWGNKNVDVVLDAWAILRSRSEAMPLVVVGLPAEGQAAVEAGAAARGIGDLVTVRPWLRRTRIPAAVHVCLPGRLPVRLRGFRSPRRGGDAPRDPGGGDTRPRAARGHGRAGHGHGRLGCRLARPGCPAGAPAPARKDLEAGVEHAATFTWQRTASNVREALAASIG